jgi:hypothetical protein
LAIGATALAKANYARQAYYGQAFFALSIGMERSAKLCILLDYCIQNGGPFPVEKIIRLYGHRVDDLLRVVDEIAGRVGATRMPRSDIHDAIVEVLSLFADNVTRYYNLQFLTGSAHAKASATAMWYERVVRAVAEKHYTRAKRQRAEQSARLIESLVGSMSSLLHHDEAGNDINSVVDGSLATALNKATTPYVRMYVLQIARFLANVIDALWPFARKLRGEDIPDLSEFYAHFYLDDAMFRTRKTWSMYQ